MKFKTTLYALEKFGIVLLFLSLSPISSATIIESGVPGKLSVDKQGTLQSTGEVSLRVKAEASGNAVNDLTAQSCISVSGEVYVNPRDHVTVNGWGSVGLNFSKGQPASFTLQLVNNCTTSFRRYFALFDLSNTSSFLGDWYEVPAKTTCSLDVNTAPAIPVLNPGNPVNAINLTTSATGSGTVSFKPDQHTGDKGKIVNDKNYLTYYVQGAAWNASSELWSGPVSGSYALKIDDVPRSTVPGVYKGTMTATISCE